MSRICACLLVVLASGPARAQELFDLRARVDVPVIVASLAIGATPELLVPLLEGPACVPDCDPGRVPALDRWALGRSSAIASILSDVLVLAIPAAGLAIDLADEQGEAFWQDAAVVLEAYAINVLLVSLAKFSVRRPRPYAYDRTRPLEERRQPSASLSFFSGHTGSAFVTATAFAEIFRRRHDGAVVPVVWGTGLGLATLVGLFRVLAGKHFPTDVLVGAIVGSSLGVLVPALHDRR